MLFFFAVSLQLVLASESSSGASHLNFLIAANYDNYSNINHTFQRHKMIIADITIKHDSQPASLNHLTVNISSSAVYRIEMMMCQLTTIFSSRCLIIIDWVKESRANTVVSAYTNIIRFLFLFCESGRQRLFMSGSFIFIL